MMRRIGFYLGKKPILLTLVIIMAVGFAVAGSAKSLYVLIIGRGTFRSPISFLIYAKGLTIAISLSGVQLHSRIVK